MRLAPDGKAVWGPVAIWFAGSIAVAAALHSTVSIWVVALGAVPFIFTCWFFRDPARHVPDIANAVVAPADGKIIEIRDVSREDAEETDQRKISIFMSIFNVHVNRIPMGGVISALRYNAGKFLAAFQDKASLLNEQQHIEIKTSSGVVACVQIAGWLARRIVCHLEEGQQVQTGERFGLIRFGSRVDLYVPSTCQLSVSLNQKVRAGETIIGILHEEK
jgi:phosphatidylserine decarboxylase